MEEQRFDDDDVAASSSLRARHFLLIVLLVAVAVAALWYFTRDRVEEAGPPVPDRVTKVAEGSRAVSLYFADPENEGLVTETRMVAIGAGFVEQVEQVVGALLSGPENGGVSTIATGTRLLDVFYDNDMATIYLDFSSELVAGHPGGSTAEYYTVSAIMRTVSQNFPQVKAVQLLIEGLQIGTIAGHIDAYGPFYVEDWR